MCRASLGCVAVYPQCDNIYTSYQISSSCHHQTPLIADQHLPPTTPRPDHCHCNRKDGLQSQQSILGIYNQYLVANITNQILDQVQVVFDPISMRKTFKQAGTELGQAQLQLELGFTLIKVCCIILMITNYHYISLSTIGL